MPQIGWFEILVVVVLAILIIGPKDFPIVVKKIGKWVGSTRRYFSDIQKNMNEMETAVEEEISIENKYSEKKKDIKKNE
tara:strand:+ start:553 stop:789 length:237 start_codon:yes stop_codon:yes gene_type:complete